MSKLGISLNQPKEIPSNIGDYLQYNRDTGELTWKVKRKSVNKGDRAGRVGPRGYAQVGFNRAYYGVHRVCFFLATGEQPQIVDHINGDAADNRLNNLRASCRSRNQQNRKPGKNNKTGISGVKFLPSLKKPTWQAGIGVGGGFLHLGNFPSLLDAASARRSSENKLFGAYSFNRSRSCQS